MERFSVSYFSVSQTNNRDDQHMNAQGLLCLPAWEVSARDQLAPTLAPLLSQRSLAGCARRNQAAIGARMWKGKEKGYCPVARLEDKFPRT